MTDNEPTTTTDPKVCTVCAHWTCDACGWTRPNADRRFDQRCAQCGSRTGSLRAVRHQQASAAEQHARIAESEAYMQSRRTVSDPAQLELLDSLDRIIRLGDRAASFLSQASQFRTQSHDRVHLLNWADDERAALITEIRVWVAAHPGETPDA